MSAHEWVQRESLPATEEFACAQCGALKQRIVACCEAEPKLPALAPDRRRAAVRLEVAVQFKPVGGRWSMTEPACSKENGT